MTQLTGSRHQEVVELRKDRTVPWHVPSELLNVESTGLLCCPSCHGDLSSEPGGLRCGRCDPPSGRLYPIADGVPAFVADSELGKQDRYVSKLYNVVAPLYDVLIPSVFPLMGVTERQVRQEILAAVQVPPGGKVLEVSVGTGANLPLLRQAVPTAKAYGVDISRGMLRKCRANLAKWNIHDVPLYCANGSALPFRDDQFDVVFHVGGINSFGDKKAALQEMLRVLKPGGRVVLNDEGLSPAREQQWYARLFIKTIFGLFASLERGDTEPPLSAIPSGVKDQKLEYMGNGYFWLISFVKAGG